MDKVFRVIVHTPDENFHYNVLATDDLVARQEALYSFREECAKRGIQVPEVQFCETKFIVELTEHEVQLPTVPL